MSALFVGRDAELARARAAVERAAGGDGALLFFAGEPGIGKTRLADRAARFAAERGASIAWGRCWEAGDAPAYWPWIQVFRVLGMDDPFARAEPSEGGEARQARFVLFDRAVRSLREAAAKAPLAIVLDDLHAADLPSLLLLQLLARELRGARIALIGTYRDAEARLAPDVGATLAKIAREGDVVSVARLSRDEVAEWVRQAAPCATDAIADAVHRVAEGNPLFVEELLRIGGGVDPGRLPDGLVAVLDEHLARLSPDARSELGAAAVLGREFQAADVAAIAESEPDASDARLKEALAAGVVTAIEPRRLAFAHMLLRDRIYGALAPSRRAALHWRAGERLLARPDAIASAARHLMEGHAAGDVDRAVAAARDAVTAATKRLAFEEAAEIGRRALALVEERPSPGAAAAEIIVTCAEALFLGGSAAEARALCVRAADLAKERGDPLLLARAALAYATEIVAGLVDPTMVGLLREALERWPEGDHPVRARLMVRLAAAIVPPKKAEREEVLALARGARAMAERIGDTDTQLYVLRFGASALGYLIGGDERHSWAGEIVTLALALNHRATLLTITPWWISSLLERGDRVEAEQTLAAYEDLVASFPVPYFQWRLPFVRSSFAAIDGDLEEAGRLADEGLAIAERGGAASAAVAWALHRISLAHSRGDPASIAPHAERVLTIVNRIPALFPYAAWVHAALGDRERALTLLRDVRTHDRHFPWLIIAGDAAAMLGSPELADAIYPALAHQEAYQNRVFWGPAGAFALGPTSRTLGDLALLLGRRDEALAHYDDAIATCERLRARRLLDLSRRGRERAVALGASPASPSSAPPIGAHAAAPEPVAPNGPRVPTLRRDGELWAIDTADGRTLRLKDSKGVRYLERLLGVPGREVHVFELAGIDEAPGDAGAALDAKAKEAYRRRCEDLRDELEEARRFGDEGRTRRAEAELEAIAEQLASAVGLGGRDRVAASNVERTRVNVQRRLKDALDRLAELDPDLGRYLAASVKTGTFCVFTPL